MITNLFSPQSLRRNGHFWILFILIALTAFPRFYHLEQPKDYYFDEVYYAFTAQEIVKGNEDVWDPWAKPPEGFSYEWTHPPLGKFLIVVGIRAFGDVDNTFGWRVMPAVFGSLGVLLIYLLSCELFPKKRAIGLFAAFLYAFDGVPLVFSRISGADIFVMCFILLASLFFVKFVRRERFFYLLLCGLFCGMTVSVKWTGLYLIEFLGALTLVVLAYRKQEGEMTTRGVLESIVSSIPTVIVFFLLVPLTIYLISYLPYFLEGYGLKDLFTLHGQMYGFHQGLAKEHSYSSQWWQWPLMLRPVYLYLGHHGSGVNSHIYSLGNPFIWWTSCGFFLWALYELWKKEVPGLVFAVLSLLAFWLPWAISPRKIVFNYHFLPSMPFMFIISAYFLDRLWSGSKENRQTLIIYVFIAIAFFAFFSPLYFGIPLNDSVLKYWFWIKSWR